MAFTATVPDWAVPALTQQIADYAAQAAADEQSATESVEQRVRRLLTMIKTAHGWAFIKAMAHLASKSPTGWVEWTALCDTMSMSPGKLSGVVGGIERNPTLRATPLYERAMRDGKPQFRMDHATLKVIFAVARERSDATLNADATELFL